MVDEYPQIIPLSDEQLGSDSSMVDEYKQNPRVLPKARRVQIPLWSMNTRVVCDLGRV